MFIKFDIWAFLKKLSRKFKFHYSRTRIKGTLLEDKYTFLIIAPSILLRISDKSCREFWNTHYVQQLFLKKCAIYEIMWKNVVERGRPQMTIWRMHIACWIPKTTNMYSEYVILIAFPLQWWLHKYASMLHYTYTVSLVQFSWISLVILFCTFPLMMYWHPVPVVNTFTTFNTFSIPT